MVSGAICEGPAREAGRPRINRKPKVVVTTAIASEMVGFVWATSAGCNHNRPPDPPRAEPAKETKRSLDPNAGAHGWGGPGGEPLRLVMSRSAIDARH